MGESASVLDDRLARRPVRQGQKFWRPQRRVDGRPPSVSGSGAGQIGREVLSLFARGSNRSQRIQKGIES
jgi:hypothetical protein